MTENHKIILPSGSGLIIALTGQPNCGKSTLFNEVVGYKSFTSNFPGTTVEFMQGQVSILSRTHEILDLPGIYSLTSLDPAGSETQRCLLENRIDVLVNVMDASLLARSLELTLQLFDLEIPMILCLNMIDEAERKGIKIDPARLREELGVPVVTTVASKGRGVREMFVESLKAANRPMPARPIRWRRDVELVRAKLTRELCASCGPIPYSRRVLAVKLLEQDPFFEKAAAEACPDAMDQVQSCRMELARSHGRRPDEVIASERHALVMEIAEKTSVVGKPKVLFRDRIDDVLMHPVWGYVSLAVILIGFFMLVFRAGALLEAPLVSGMEGIVASVQNRLGSGFWAHMAVSGLAGIGSGVAVVLPYLVPFLMGLAILEDVGYLPRVAFLMDAFMHRIGLHGMAVIPAILGYGCNVPAVMAVRILDSPRDRFIASIVATIVPCSARMTIIMGLTGAYAGGLTAFGVYALNFLVAAAVGGIASRLMPEVTPGMMLEMPVYHRPRGRVVWFKTWLRLKEFIVVAWPLLIAGTAVLGLADHFGWTPVVNRMLSPLTGTLGLPVAVGMTLIFGLLRKELSMLMLFAALGTRDVASVMSVNQIMTFTVFVVFYVPCVATLGMLIRQIGLRRTGFVFILLFVIALLLALATQFIWGIF